MYFRPLKKDQVSLVHDWFKQEYVAQFWYGVGLQNTFRSIDRFVKGEETPFRIWLAYDQETPFAYLMTSKIDLEKDLQGKYCSPQAEAISIDLFIGNAQYLGKGLAHIMIQEILKQEFPYVSDAFIDPDVKNSRAIHVFEKAGFVKCEEFIPSWDPASRCLLMHMKRGRQI